MNRKTFLKSAALSALASSIFTASAQPSSGMSAPRKRQNMKKGLMYNSFRAEKLSVMEKFKLARAAGFDGIEIRAALNQKEVLAARDATGLAIPSVTGNTATGGAAHAQDLHHGIEPLREGIRVAARPDEVVAAGGERHQVRLEGKARSKLLVHHLLQEPAANGKVGVREIALAPAQFLSYPVRPAPVPARA